MSLTIGKLMALILQALPVASKEPNPDFYSEILMLSSLCPVYYSTFYNESC